MWRLVVVFGSAINVGGGRIGGGVLALGIRAAGVLGRAEERR